jgi:hypothetical protein
MKDVRTEKPEKQEYEKPEVVDYGDLVELTAGGVKAGAQDMNWPSNEKAQKYFS